MSDRNASQCTCPPSAFGLRRHLLGCPAMFTGDPGSPRVSTPVARWGHYDSCPAVNGEDGCCCDAPPWPDTSAADALGRRLAAAERVCYLVGITAARTETDRDKALTQAWQEWARDYRQACAGVSDAEVVELAARRDVIRQRTLARLGREAEAEKERLRRLDLLECLSIEQSDTVLSCGCPGWNEPHPVQPGCPAYDGPKDARMWTDEE